MTPDQHDDYLRQACGLPCWDGPPPTLTLDQARLALSLLATDADKEVARKQTYNFLLARDIRNAKQPEPTHPFTSKQ